MVDPNGIYSKHYYAGSQRIVSRLGSQTAQIFNYSSGAGSALSSEGSQEFNEQEVQTAQVADLQQYLNADNLGVASFQEYVESSYQQEELLLQEELEQEQQDMELDEGMQLMAPTPTEPVQAPPIYYYHPDHLGTSTSLTDANGSAYQFFLNLPFGETLAEQFPSYNNYYRTPFKFSGKEMDEQTGLHYFGARYYDSQVSIWLSVDPLAEKFPSWNPYNYTMQNPINLIDPSGMSPEDTDRDYLLNKDGSLTKLNDNTTPDRVFNDAGEFVELEYHGQIENASSYGKSSIINFTGSSNSTTAFEFFAENSNVEWGHIITDKESFVMTDKDPLAVNGGGYAYSLLKRGHNVIEEIHSHAVHYIGGETPSGYGFNPTKNNTYSEPSPYDIYGDHRSLRDLIYGFSVKGVHYEGFGDKARNIITKVYNPVSKTYIQYDEKKAVKLD